jgi:hypothetical protein
VQIYASPRLELFANTSYVDAKASIFGLNYDPTSLAGPTPGLDWYLMSDSFSSFSDLQFRQVVQSAGFRYRLSPELMLNGGVEYSDDRDRQPYLFDTTGRRVGYFVGVDWIF